MIKLIQAISSGICIAAFALLSFAGCGSDSAPKSLPVPEVTVEKPAQRPVTDYLEFTGNAEASDKVELRARVSGFLTKVNFRDGDLVKEGDLLFEIEPEPYAARLKLAESQIAGAQAELQRAVLEYNRQAELVKQKAVAVSEVEKWKAQRDAAQAKLNSVQAEVDLARIQFGYTEIRAPFDGRVDRSLKDPGNLVGVGEATLLSTIYRMDPIYAYFSINEKDFVKVRRPPETADTPVKVFLGGEGEEGYPHEGEIDFGSTALDESTGTMLLRGVFTNPPFGKRHKMVPGMFVRLRVPVKERSSAILVSDRAVGVDQSGRFVLTVSADGVVDKKPVKVGALSDGLRVVEEGLNGDESVIVRGIQQARPGGKVKPISASAS
ncbi:MAG TPA: efflux RND transporter periplasmic adaptor subunit [Oligoflexia bacterium]|nr:efflux RND transporter periplasmic adaptor subunit [Oligoflexia bacterium]